MCLLRDVCTSQYMTKDLGAAPARPVCQGTDRRNGPDDDPLARPSRRKQKGPAGQGENRRPGTGKGCGVSGRLSA